MGYNELSLIFLNTFYFCRSQMNGSGRSWFRWTPEMCEVGRVADMAAAPLPPWHRRARGRAPRSPSLPGAGLDPLPRGRRSVAAVAPGWRRCWQRAACCRHGPGQGGEEDTGAARRAGLCLRLSWSEKPGSPLQSSDFCRKHVVSALFYI